MARRKGHSLDIHRLHVWMWDHRTRENYLSVGQVELAAKLGVAQFSANRYLRFMTAQGRLKRLGQGKYIVTDPEHYMWEKKLGPGRRNQRGDPWFENGRANHSNHAASPDGARAVAETDDHCGGMPELRAEDTGL